MLRVPISLGNVMPGLRSDTLYLSHNLTEYHTITRTSTNDSTRYSERGARLPASTLMDPNFYDFAPPLRIQWPNHDMSEFP